MPIYNTGTVNWSLVPINEDVNLLSAPECPELKSDQCDQDHDRWLNIVRLSLRRYHQSVLYFNPGDPIIKPANLNSKLPSFLKWQIFLVRFSWIFRIFRQYESEYVLLGQSFYKWIWRSLSDRQTCAIWSERRFCLVLYLVWVWFEIDTKHQWMLFPPEWVPWHSLSSLSLLTSQMQLVQWGIISHWHCQPIRGQEGFTLTNKRQKKCKHDLSKSSNVWLQTSESELCIVLVLHKSSPPYWVLDHWSCTRGEWPD